MMPFREWWGKIKSKFNGITQKLNSAGKLKVLINHKIVFLLIIIFTIAIAVVFSQYPQVLTSFAKPPQQPCGFEDDKNKKNRCCAGDVCNPGLKCYSPDKSTPKRCKSIGSVCGNSVDRPCCLPDGGNEQTQEFCNANLDLACDTSKKPQYPYQNPWNSGMCKLSYETCGGQGEDCCYTSADEGRCDGTLTCLNTGRGNDQKCEYEDVKDFSIWSASGEITVNKPAYFSVFSHYNGLDYYATLNCENRTTTWNSKYVSFTIDPEGHPCIFSTSGEHSVHVKLDIYSPSNGDKTFDQDYSFTVLDQPTPTPTSGPPACNPSQLTMSVNPNPGTDGKNMTFSLSGNQGSTLRDDFWSGGVNCSGGFWGNLTCRATKTGSYSWIHYWKNCAPNNCNITSAQCSKIKSFTVKSAAVPTATNTPIPTYTCNGTCIFGTNECYQVGTGTCPSNKYCCKIINSPTPIPPTAVPTKVPNGGACNLNSQCNSGICCPEGYCKTPGKLCLE